MPARTVPPKGVAHTDPAAILERAEREKVKFLRLQFTDILGTIKNVEIPDRQFEDALDGQIMFDGSSIEGFVRIEESDMYLRPDLEHVRGVPVGAPGRREGRAHDLRHLPARRRAVRRLSALDAEARHRAGRRAGLRDERRARGRVLPVPAPKRRADDRDARHRQLLRPDAGRPGRGRAARDRAGARADGLPRRGRAPRSGARASTRSTSGTTTC